MKQRPEDFASIRLIQADVHVLIIGGGQGGVALLDVFKRCRSWLHIDGLVDIDPIAPAIQIARSQNIPTSHQTEKTVSAFDGDIIIDVTGNSEVNDIVKKYRKNTSTEVISANSARLLFDLICRQREAKDTIQSQDLRLNLLSSMLDISLKLEQHKNTSDMLQHAIQGIHSSLSARKSLAIILTEEGCESFGILDTDVPKFLPPEFAGKLQHQFSNFDERDKQHQYFEHLDPPISVPAVEENFNLAIPLLQDGTMVALLLVQNQNDMDDGSSMMLTLAASHLRLAIKALESHQRLEIQASNDPLTQCYNRRYFEKRLKQETARVKRIPDAQLSCMFFDMDNFKPINDLYSHHTGDVVLQTIAKHIQDTLRGYDIFARFGGDEFVALLPLEHGAEVNTAEEISQRILENIKAIRLDGYPDLCLSVSIGVATLYSWQLKDGSSLVQLADKALYQAKEMGKGCIHAISPEAYTDQHSDNK